MFDINLLIRKNIRSLVPYSSARDEYKGEEAVFLDANENPFNTPLNRYPDPHQLKLKKTISTIKNVPAECIFLGNGSDEAIDLLIRAFCEPGVDNIVSIKPTYGMYKVCADINNVEFREVLLNKDFQPDTEGLLKRADNNSKLLFLCSPNNPTSNSFKKEDLLHLVKKFPGLVIIDEAYIDFSGAGTLTGELGNYPNLVILQTFSKAWGMAGVRLGMAFAGKEIIDVLSHIKYPYNINVLTQRTALECLSDTRKKDTWIREILDQREYLRKELSRLPMVKHILPSDANFLMVRFDNPQEIFHYLINKKIIVRDRSKVILCEGFLRITVGSEAENSELVKALQQY
ncbi:MAG: histidinol-phosphate transaminase [Bacteroidales bacterium]|nr:histidinol-phosphate transaminase [Bacteroidales bacterium]